MPKVKRKKWTVAEFIHCMMLKKKGHSVSEIARTLRRSYRSVRAEIWRYENKGDNFQKRQWTDQEIDECKRLINERYPIVFIATSLNRSTSSVRSMLSREKT